MKTNNKHNDLGFKVPDGYFESLQSRMLDHVAVKDSGFKVPDSYFETLEERLLKHAVKQEDKVETKVVDLNTNYRQWLVPLLIAAAVLVAVLTINGFNNNGASEFKHTVAAVDSEELMEYLLKQPMMEEAATLEYIYEETTLPHTTVETNTVEDEELEEYLLNTMDESSFID